MLRGETLMMMIVLSQHKAGPHSLSDCFVADTETSSERSEMFGPSERRGWTTVDCSNREEWVWRRGTQASIANRRDLERVNP